MRILSIRLENYIGIYNGRGDNILEVDLSNSTSSIVIIRGLNGSGKSTLLRSLSPMPDKSDQFIPGSEAKKIIKYLVNGDIIDIEYDYPIKNDGSRGLTKAQVYKNGEPLNLTRNVSDAKEIIFALFNVDTNFLALSQLSSDDRGLADKKPAERKSFVNSIINGIEVYNAMFKTINKKYSLFKGLINSISTKINKIGNKEEINASFNSINGQLEKVIHERDIALAEVAKIRAKIDSEDAVSIMEKYDSIDKQIIELQSLLLLAKNELIDNNLSEYSLDSSDDIDKLRKLEKDSIIQLSELRSSLKELISKKDSSNELKNELYGSMQKEITKKNGFIGSDISDEIIDIYEKTIKDIKVVNSDIANYGFKVDSKSDIQSLIDLLQDIANTLQYITDGINSIDHNEGFKFIRENKDKLSNDNLILSNLRDEISGYTRTFDSNNLEINIYENHLEKANQLELRPKGCKFNDCVFIEDAIKASKLNPSKVLEDLHAQQKELDFKIKESKRRLDTLSDCFAMRDKFNKLYDKITLYKDRLGSVGFIKLLDIDYLANIGITNNLQDLKEKRLELNDFYNLLEIKENYEITINKYKDSMDTYLNNKAIIDMINESIDSYKEKIETIDKDLVEINTLIVEKEDSVKSLEKSSSFLSLFIDTKASKISEAFNNLSLLEKEKEVLSQKVIQAKTLNKELEQACIISDNINERYNELLKQRDIISFNKITIEEYIRELEEYKDKFEKVETIRYYVSPTTGIQTVFIGAYMNDIIIKANELLSLIFNGQFVIQPFIINETEFRIPCLGNGLLNDDISSMSTSQICMISMIISFAILASSNTDYNILKLDEIDGGLDTENRIQFITLLSQLIQMVGCEQCFLISHNMEYSNNVSVIDMTQRPIKVI